MLVNCSIDNYDTERNFSVILPSLFLPSSPPFGILLQDILRYLCKAGLANVLEDYSEFSLLPCSSTGYFKSSFSLGRFLHWFVEVQNFFRILLNGMERYIGQMGMFERQI